jgi:PAS domain S-box-containing protein
MERAFPRRTGPVPTERAAARLRQKSTVDDKRLLLMESERQLLSKIAAGVPLPQVLDELLRAVEAGAEGEMLASILLLDCDGTHLLHGAAPGLPQAYNDAIDGGAIGPNAGSCGTAAFLGRPVFVSDIANDPLWADYRDLALAHGLAACWSTPIKAADGRMLGTFAIYYREPRSPTPQDLDAIGLITHTAALAIERDLSERLLRESEARLQEALAAGRVMAFEWDPATGRSQRSANAAQILGSEPEEGGSGRFNTFLARVHPDDRARFRAHLFGVSREKPSFSVSFRYLRPDGREVWLEETASAEFDAAGRYVRLKGLTRDITGKKRAEERQNLLIAELDHRVKNALACVAVVAQHTRERSRSMDEFVERLTGRIQSMANTHALLSRGRWQGASVSDLAHCVLAPCLAGANAVVEGPEVVLSAEATQALAMAIHELVTNAAKYGALSAPEGRVSVRWECRRGGDRRRRLVLDWQEMGGPPVAPPSHHGYGTSVIRDLIPYELGGGVDLSFARDGVRCRLEIPLER